MDKYRTNPKRPGFTALTTDMALLTFERVQAELAPKAGRPEDALLWSQLSGDVQDAWCLGIDGAMKAFNASTQADKPDPTCDVINPDPWAHRSAGMKCRTCMWYVAKVKFEADPAAHPDSLVVRKQQVGRCRKRAPDMCGYPVVYQTDWCGDHKLDETK